MKRFLLDTGIAADYLNKRNGVFDHARAEQKRGRDVGICIPVLAELCYGIEKSTTRDENFRLLRAALPTIRLWPFEKAATFEYGRLAAELRWTGRPMQVMDIMIAAIALTIGGCTVVTKDSDFSAVPGLRVENWAAPDS